MEWNHPSIIAMKGFPFTGKTKIAYEIACHLRFCLLLSLDDIIHSVTPPCYSSTPNSDRHLIDKAFGILLGLVKKQMSIGHSVVIDSLPSRRYLDRLVAVSNASNATKVVIIDCRVDKPYAWQMRFIRKFDPKSIETAKLPWYKCREWEEVEKIVKEYDKSLDQPVQGVSRLMLNVDQPQRVRHVIQAIQTLVFCKDDRHVDYYKWGDYNESLIHGYEYHDDHTNCTSGCGHGHAGHGHTRGRGDGHEPREEKELYSRRIISRSTRRCKDGHSITVLEKEGLVEDYEADCAVCGSRVEGFAYTCSSCRLAIHKSCGEFQSSEKTSFTPQEFPTFIEKSVDHDPNSLFYSFPLNLPCLLCEEAGKEFSQECSSCIFESHLKNRLVPTIIEHEGHEHKLSLWAMKISGKGAYQCEACGKEGAYAAYACYGCSKNYHVECALFPYPIKGHVHGGHKHPVQQMYVREDTDFDDFPCDHCADMINPEDWYYHCPDCPQFYHLDCAFFTNEANHSGS